MERCPKCETGRFSNPVYMKYPSEHLVRRCSVCGFSRKEPTADNKYPSDRLAELIKLE